MINEKWLATNGKRIWEMEHEGDYRDGDVVICVKVNSKSSVELSMISQDQTPVRVKVDA